MDQTVGVLDQIDQ